jgi:ABC-type transporter Mla subunit MlaD
LILDVGVGAGVLLMGIGIFIAMLALAKTFGRLNVTLDEVDRQLEGLGKPVSATLEHVGGIADTADQTIARLSGVVKSLEDVAGSVSRTAALTKDALSPAIVNVGATLSGVSAGLRRLVTGRNSPDES